MDAKEVYKFCPRCGAKFAAKTDILKCDACGLSFYVNPKPVMSVILLNDKDEIMFTIRAIEPRKGYLDFPGGFTEEGENLEDTTRREIKEELGIEIGELEYLSTDGDRYLYDGINYHTTGVTYLGKLPKGAEIKPADDVESVEFYKIEDIPMDQLAWPSMRRMIEALKSKRSN
jgi:NAD+ diphosphatase